MIYISEYRIVEIESDISLPFDLININYNNINFSFYFSEFDKYQTDSSIQMGGVTGKFGINYIDDGIHAYFKCDVTIGNVFCFYKKLVSCYEILNGSAILSDYSNENTFLKIEFDKTGHCKVNGSFVNKNHFNNIKSKIEFEFNLDQTYLFDNILNMKYFFRIIEEIQNNSIFY